MNKIRTAVLMLLGVAASLGAQSSSSQVLRVGIVGMAHDHLSGFLSGGALAPAGGALKRSDVQIVGFVDPDRRLFDKYARLFHLSPSLYFASIEEMVSHAHPQAALVFTSTFDHTKAVEDCANLGVHVMMEKPLAVSHQDALRMVDAARRGHVHVLVDYETSWYASNLAAHDLVVQNALGDVRKVVVRDGHKGPKLIGVHPEFFAWLTDPRLDGGGALYDFGCYGADLMTWLMKGEAPQSVTAVTEQLQPDIYPKVDDEADIVVKYPTAIGIFQASWNWPFDIKNMDVYGRTGYVKTILHDEVEVRREGEAQGHVTKAKPVPAPFDDPLHLLAAVIRGEVSEDGTLSGLNTNVIVSEILDAARQSAKTGRTINLPLH